MGDYLGSAVLKGLELRAAKEGGLPLPSCEHDHDMGGRGGEVSVVAGFLQVCREL